MNIDYKASLSGTNKKIFCFICLSLQAKSDTEQEDNTTM